jgi:uncharacterized linocin/CFP29 family protein
MSDKYLARGDAPFGSEVWEKLDARMIEAAKSQLVGRKLLPIEGPLGLGVKTISLQDEANEAGLSVSNILPLAMIRSDFTMGTRDLSSFEREGFGLDLGPVSEAAMETARLEDDLIFNGVQAGIGSQENVDGLLTVEGANSQLISSWDGVGSAADDIMQAITTLDEAGFHGPYVMALAPALYNKLFRLYPRGNKSEMDHLQQMVTRGIAKAPVLSAGGVLMAAGRQYASLVLGQDMTIGFVGPGDAGYEFYIMETLALRIRQPEAICILTE